MSNKEAYPDDLQSCHALLDQFSATTKSLAQANEHLKQEIELLKRHIYGRRSERHVEDDSQLSLFGPSDEAETSPAAEEMVEEEITYRRRRRSQNKENEDFPEHFPREVGTVDVPEDDRCCECCGETMPVIGEDVRKRLEFVPAKFVVHETHYLKRACGKCKQGVVSPPPQSPEGGSAGPIAGGRYGFGVYAQLITSKFADHLPLYRQEDIFARAGVMIPRSTMCGMLAASAEILSPLVDLMTARLLAGSIIGADDTPVRLQDAALPGKMRTARFWLYRGREGAPYNVFDFHESRSRDGPNKVLKDYRGWVTVDAYGVNDGVYLGADGRIAASCCNAHARRKFVDARGNDPLRASWALAMYQRLYDIEDRGRDLSVEDRLELRRTESLPLMNELREWLEVQRDNPKVLPKSAIGKAIQYALNQWQSLLAFTTDGSLPIDNNDTERDLRRLTVGRKNWLFLGSHDGGGVAAKLFTITASAARHELDVWAYVNDVLRQLSSGEADLERLLPDRWRAEHPESVRTYRQQQREARAAKTKDRRSRRRKLKAKLGK